MGFCEAGCVDVVFSEVMSGARSRSSAVSAVLREQHVNRHSVKECPLVGHAFGGLSWMWGLIYARSEMKSKHMPAHTLKHRVQTIVNGSSVDIAFGVGLVLNKSIVLSLKRTD